MNISVILIETLVLIVLFTIAVAAGSKNPVDTVYDMPQPIIDRCLELGLIVDWYDCFVIDWIWVCHSKKLIIPGTEDLMDSYKDYRFHFIASLKGMLIGLPVCLLAGVLVQLVNWII